MAAREPASARLLTDKDVRGLLAASSLTPTERLTVIMACDAMSRANCTIQASYHRLAQLFGVSRRTAIYRMQRLEAKGVLVKERSGGGRYENGRGRVNIWFFDTSMIPRASHKGATNDTVMGEAEMAEGCNRQAPTVQPVAQDPTLSTPIKEEAQPAPSPAPAARGGGGTMAKKPKDPRDVLRPWVNKMDDPKISRSRRLEQLRAQAAIADRQTRDVQTDLVQFDSEGGKDGSNLE